MFLEDREKIIKEITDIADKKEFCIVELNPKKLSNGTPRKVKIQLRYIT